MSRRSKIMPKRRLPALMWVVSAMIFLSLTRCCEPKQESHPYLILYAFDTEGQTLAGMMQNADSMAVLGRPVFSGRLSGKDIILAESGIGMTNAAMTAQRMIDEYDPKAVIFTGIAGAVDISVHIGDIAVCGRWIAHDYVYYGADGPEPMKIGAFSPGKKEMIEFVSFPVDSLMLDEASGLADDEINFRSIEDRIPEIRVGGTGVSGNAFIDNRDKRIWLSKTFGAIVTDMETASVAQVCEVNGLPFIAFRSASDLAGGSGSASAQAELDRFFEIAAENSSKLVVRFLEIL